MSASPPSGPRLLLPETLAGLATLDLVARAAMQGLLHGMHRSPQFGFSQEFKEYRAYNEGDDPRFVDWNVYARTERTYIRRYEGETNTRLMVVLDASASMNYASRSITKLQYAKYLAATLGYLASRQHDPVGLLVFDEKLRHYRPPSSRQGSLISFFHALEDVQAGGQTDFKTSFEQFQQHLSRRGLVAVISDLYCDPEIMTRAVQPLAYHGHDVMIFQLLDPEELAPTFDESVVLEDMESKQAINVSPQYLSHTYRERMNAHIAALRSAAARVGAQQVTISTAEPLDRALRKYLMFRQAH
jgi:uncharacterized protein (DUF58 family)